MAATTHGLVVVNVTMSADCVEYDVPAGVMQVTFVARDGEIALSHEEDGATHVMRSGASAGPFTGYCVPKGSYWFEGANNVILEVLLWYGPIRT